MRDAILKRSALSVLGPEPDLSGIEALQNCDKNSTRKLLHWLDQSGLALHFYRTLRRKELIDHVGMDLRKALEQRIQENRVRMHAMLGEFKLLNESLTSHGVRYSCLKGFSLVPEYCPDASLRHQTDFDFLIARESVDDAARAVESCGYRLEESGPSGEMTFGTPLLRIPSHHDNIYEVPQHRQVDLHTMLWHEAHGVRFDAPTGCLNRLQCKRFLGIPFPALAQDDMFLLQVMHAFQHLLGSWIRLSWLWELDYFLGTHKEDAALWQSVCDRASRDRNLRRAFGLILRLTNQIFHRPLPAVLEAWCLAPLSSNSEAWIRHFGLTWAISDLPGKKVTLFVHRDFVNDSNLWRKYLRRRIFPLHLRSSLKLGIHLTLGGRIKARISRYIYALGRVMFHVREMASLAVETIRWRRALRSLPSQRAAIQAD
jgi:hypothetical protein